MKHLGSLCVISGLVFGSTAAVAAEYSSYIGVSAERATLEYKALGLEGDTDLNLLGVRMGINVLPFVALEARGATGISDSDGDNDDRFKLDHSLSGLVVLGPNAAMDLPIHPYVALGWSQTKFEYDAPLNTTVSRKVDGPTWAVGATLHAAGLGINVEYKQLFDETVNLAGVDTDSKMTGYSLSLFKYF